MIGWQQQRYERTLARVSHALQGDIGCIRYKVKYTSVWVGKRPAEVMGDGAVDGLILAAAWICQHVVVVAIVVNVFVLRDQMNIQHADVDAKSWLAVPERVVRLRSVSDIVGRLQAAAARQIFHQHVIGRLHAQTYRQRSKIKSESACYNCAWANDTAAHYATIHFPRQWTIRPAVCSQQTYHRLNQPHYICLHSVAHKLIPALIFDPAEDKILSWLTPSIQTNSLCCCMCLVSAGVLVLVVLQ